MRIPDSNDLIQDLQLAKQMAIDGRNTNHQSRQPSDKQSYYDLIIHRLKT